LALRAFAVDGGFLVPVGTGSNGGAELVLLAKVPRVASLNFTLAGYPVGGIIRNWPLGSSWAGQVTFFGLSKSRQPSRAQFW